MTESTGVLGLGITAWVNTGVTTGHVAGVAGIGVGVSGLYNAGSNLLFSTDAGGGGAGGQQPRGQRTAQDIISSEKKGSIKSEFPGEFLNTTIDEIDRLAKAGNKAARTAKKLLSNNRFNKGS